MTEAKPIPNQKLRYERERRAWSQQDVADKVGTTPLNVGRWERGVTTPGPYFRQKLCDIFEKTPQELGLVHETAGTEIAAPAPARTPSTALPHEAPALLWNVPYNRNPLFTGREDILAQLHDAFLNGEQPIALAQPQAISGLGGIGKTQTAVEYAYRYRDSYEAVFWARADSADLLSSDYLTIASLLALPQRGEQDQSLVVKAVLRWFDMHERWLLILDNADDLEAISPFIPSSGKGHVLLTTRAHSTGTIAGRVELDTMGQEEGTFLLLRRAKLLKGSASSLQAVSEALRSQAQAIVEAVDGLPLALDQAGAYIEGTGCSLSDYLKFYQTRRHRLLRTRGESATGHPEPVATTWSLSFDKVERANPAAAELLRLCAFLHPDAIPESMIIEGASELGPILQPVAEDEMELNEAIGELRKYSLVKRDPELKLLNIHRLVQAVIKDGMDAETQREWAETAIRAINKAFPDAEFAAWDKCQQYLPHAQTCMGFVIQWHLATLEAAHLSRKVGNYFAERALYIEAERLLQQGITILEQIFGQVHPDVAQCLHDLADLAGKQGKYDQGIRLHQQALKIREDTLGMEHADVAQSLNNLAWLYAELGKDELAEPLYLRALTIREQTVGQEHHRTAETLNNLAFLYYRFQGRYQESEALLQRVVAIYERNLGPDHPYTAEVLYSLAGLYYRYQGRYQEAEPLMQRVVAIYEQSLGPDHPYTAGALSSLGDLYRFQGRYQEAEPLMQRSLMIYEQTLGPDHSNTASSLHNLAILYNIQQRFQEAEPLARQALAIKEQAVGSDHPDLAVILLNLALLNKNQERYQEAEQLYLRAIAITEKALGSSHPDIALFLDRYAGLLRDTNRLTEADELEARSRGIRASHSHKEKATVSHQQKTR